MITKLKLYHVLYKLARSIRFNSIQFDGLSDSERSMIKIRLPVGIIGHRSLDYKRSTNEIGEVCTWFVGDTYCCLCRCCLFVVLLCVTVVCSVREILKIEHASGTK